MPDQPKSKTTKGEPQAAMAITRGGKYDDGIHVHPAIQGQAADPSVFQYKFTPEPSSKQ